MLVDKQKRLDALKEIARRRKEPDSLCKHFLLFEHCAYCAHLAAPPQPDTEPMPTKEQLAHAEANRKLIAKLGRTVTFDQAELAASREGRTLTEFQFYNCKRQLGWSRAGMRDLAIKERKQANSDESPANGPRAPYADELPDSQLTTKPPDAAIYREPSMPPQPPAEPSNGSGICVDQNGLVELAKVVKKLGGIRAAKQALADLELISQAMG